MKYIIFNIIKIKTNFKYLKKNLKTIIKRKRAVVGPATVAYIDIAGFLKAQTGCGAGSFSSQLSSIFSLFFEFYFIYAHKSTKFDGYHHFIYYYSGHDFNFF